MLFAGSPGADFHPDLDTGPIEAVFRKGAYGPAYSGFEGIDEDGTSLLHWLREQGVDEVDIVGIATDHCVRRTAVDAAAAGLATRVLLDLTASVAQESVVAARAEMSASMAAEYVDAFFDFYVKGTLDESQPQPDVAEVTGRPPRTFRQWAQAHAGAF